MDQVEALAQGESSDSLASDTAGSIITTVSNAEKILERMRANPKADWRIDDCQTLARRYQVTWNTAGSHATFRATDGSRITIPVRRPIKPIYITHFVAFIDRLQGT
ncbi:MAG: type II toxin-antitoxin system HicA family toxin [Planctomycetes bacterium]|nr:type II toxin-antitoxin system HicA family toxin [Planctomycetota bacterium]